MIEKIITIKNVTKFHEFNCVGDIEFRPLTLIYSENGKGKSSIAAILRSLGSGDPSPIAAKQTIGVNTAPNVIVKHSSGVSEFKHGNWNQILSDIFVFDSFYVTSNIFSGDHITHGHKKNLYYLLIGEESVNIALRIEELDNEIRDLTRQIPEKEKEIKRSCFGNIELNQFLDLVPLTDVDDQIGKQNAEIDALNRSLEIRSKPPLSPVVIHRFDSQCVESLLVTTFEQISQDAENRFRQHCNKLGKNSETWVRDGVDYISDDKDICPFCGRNTSESELVAIYRQYFNKQYLTLKSDIQNLLHTIQNDFSATELLGIQKQLGENSTRALFWKTYIDGKYPEFDFALVKDAADRLSRITIDLLNRKLNSPLEQLDPTPEFDSAKQQYEKVIQCIAENNKEVEEINVLIKKKKDDVQVQSYDDAQKKLNFLQNIKVRHEPFMVDQCNLLGELKNKKDRLTQDKSKLREQLDNETLAIMEKHQGAINKYLEVFGTEFRIDKAQTSLQGGKPSVNYSLLINGENIPLGSDDTLDKPGFKTTLSDGEKNSLAFAFFLAQISHIPNLGQKIIVIDDPITSLDEQRRVCTKQEIIKLANSAKQVIVLSHDAMFLKSISDDFQNSKHLFIWRSPNGSIIKEWDIETETQSRYQKNYAKLKKYLVT